MIDSKALPKWVFKEGIAFCNSLQFRDYDKAIEAYNKIIEWYPKGTRQ